MRIAICDDDPRELSRLVHLLDAYRREAGQEILCATFSSGGDLLEHMKGGEYDLILLDVLMPGQDGIQVAREIRSFDRAIKLLFLTASPEFAAESYGVDAFYYLLKP
ncbi:MAG: response regulator, partial [Clostridia bacterium]|nr:response regulator [Clostridia bacterium]